MSIYEVLTIVLIAILATATTAAIWIGLVSWAGQCRPIGHEWGPLARTHLDNVPHSRTSV